MRTRVLPILGFAALASFASAQNFLTPELLTNPGAESGALAPSWTIVGGGTVPSVDGGAYDPGLNPHGGSWQFVGDTYPGGGGSTGGLRQTVSLGSLAAGVLASIDAGAVAARLSFWEQSLYQGGQTDYARVELTFLDVSAQPLGVEASSNLAADGNGSGGSHWVNFTSDYPVPAGTRSIAYMMLFFRGSNGGSYIDSFIDDNSLRLVSVSAVPEPAGAAVLTASFALAATAARRRRIR